MPKGSVLQLVREPSEYFQELVSVALGRRQVSVQSETQFYLVKLLHQFMSTENLYARDADGNMKAEPLAILLKEATEEKDPQARGLLFRHLGDVSLYTAGYFQESLDTKVVPVDYYIDMGGNAYQHVALSVAEKNIRKMYSELSEKFKNLVEVLADIGDRTQPKTDQNLVRVYEKWKQTGSERAQNLLKEAGILASAAAKSKKKGMH